MDHLCPKIDERRLVIRPNNAIFHASGKCREWDDEKELRLATKWPSVHDLQLFNYRSSSLSVHSYFQEMICLLSPTLRTVIDKTIILISSEKN
jgi:hypothetical protein